jgi:hypothetical protein
MENSVDERYWDSTTLPEIRTVSVIVEPKKQTETGKSYSIQPAFPDVSNLISYVAASPGESSSVSIVGDIQPQGTGPTPKVTSVERVF